MTDERRRGPPHRASRSAGGPGRHGHDPPGAWSRHHGGPFHGNHWRPRHGGPFWQRRFLRIAITITVVWIGMGIIFGFVSRGYRDRGSDTPGPIIPIIVIVAVIATVVAYRRIARPMSGLLEGATRVGAGDYDARVQPEGPRSVRTLGHAFNDMASRLEASEAARRRFLADVTHELRTPLTVLQGGVEAQLDGIHPRDDEHLATLLEQTRTLGRLVEDLRTLALGDAGQLTITSEPTSLSDVVDDAVSAIGPSAAVRSVEIVVVPGPSITLPADRVRLGQVLTNLLNNAVRHTPAGGSVTVMITAGDVATITVDDTGPGIAGDPDRVFDRFHRAADSGGSGLGLTIARQLVEAHGGTITAANRDSWGAAPPGPPSPPCAGSSWLALARSAGGARLTVTLPLA